MITRLACAAALIVALVVAGRAAEQRGLTEIPSPDVAVQLAAFQMAPGFEISLFAAEPQLSKPIHMNFDAAGRLWVVGSSLYPQIQPGEQATDKVFILEDTNGDGRADESTTFADDLLIPTGIAPDDSVPHLAAYVANSSELLYLEDTNGDKIADRRRVVFSGFGTEDTHHIIHSFRWGPGGHLFFNQSIYIHSHVETPWGPRRLLGGGVWRFQPDLMKLDVFARGGINMWGHHFDPFGQSFMTDGAGAQGINYAFPGATYETAVDAPRVLGGLNPGQPKQAGLEIVSGRHLPEAWRGRFVTSDFRGNRVNSFVLEDAGSGYLSRQADDLVVSTHRAFRPVDVKMGPDGAVYIADWYNPIIQHGEVDFRDARRDRTRGRIWRVTATARPLVERRNLSALGVPALLDLLGEPEQLTRDHAKALLKRHGPSSVLPALNAWVARLDAGDPTQARLLLEALWVRQWLNAPDADLLDRVLRSSEPRVRAGAVRVASDWADRVPAHLDLLTRAVTDPHARVRLEAVNALRLMGTAEAARVASTALDHPLDTNLDFALWVTLRELAPAWARRLAADPAFFGGDVRRLLTAVRSAGRADTLAPVLTLWRSGRIPAELRAQTLQLFGDLGGPAELDVVFNLVVSGDAPADRAGMLDALRRAATTRKVVPAGTRPGLTSLLTDSDTSVRAAALRLTGAWRFEPARAAIVSSTASDEAAVRAAAFDALVDLGSSSTSTLQQLATTGAVSRRVQAAGAMARIDPVAAAPIAATLLASPGLDDAAAASLVTSFIGQKGGHAAFATALAGRSLPSGIARSLLRAVSSSGLAMPELTAAIESASGLARVAAMPTGDALAAMIRAVETEGDEVRGEQVYRRADLMCTSCHAIAGAGGLVGPDLTSIGASAPADYLLESLLDPQARVKEGYQVVNVTRTNGSSTAGILVRDGTTEIALRDGADNVITIPASEIASRTVSSTSLMPPGLTAQLRRDEFLDLAKFLSRLGATGGVTVPNDVVVRRWEVLAADQAISGRMREEGMGYAARPNAPLPWRTTYSTAAGTLPLAEVPIVSYFNPMRYRVMRFAIDAPQAGTATLDFGVDSGLSIWLDAQPVSLSGRTATLTLAPGRHVVTMAVENAASGAQAALRVRLERSTGGVQLVSGK
jgi:putative heme-binding domain-containing protein